MSWTARFKLWLLSECQTCGAIVSRGKVQQHADFHNRTNAYEDAMQELYRITGNDFGARAETDTFFLDFQWWVAK